MRQKSFAERILGPYKYEVWITHFIGFNYTSLMEMKYVYVVLISLC